MNNNGSRREEGLIKENPIMPLPISISRVLKSLCKIKTPYKIGSGFLVQFEEQDKIFFCLMSNEHVIQKVLVEKKETISFKYEYETKEKEIYLNPEERFIKDFRDIGLDSIVIQILPKDDIGKDYFLLIDKNYINKFNELIGEDIVIIQYPKGEAGYSYGKIKDINEYEFTHSASTEPGSSGSPVFLKGNFKVIGIHKSSDNNKKENYGDFIGPIFNYFNEKNSTKVKSIKNEIVSDHNDITDEFVIKQIKMIKELYEGEKLLEQILSSKIKKKEIFVLFDYSWLEKWKSIVGYDILKQKCYEYKLDEDIKKINDVRNLFIKLNTKQKLEELGKMDCSLLKKISGKKYLINEKSNFIPVLANQCVYLMNLMDGPVTIAGNISNGIIYIYDPFQEKNEQKIIILFKENDQSKNFIRCIITL